MTKQQTIATVEQVTPLTDSILQLILSPADYIEYNAGQYLQILLAKEKDPLSYSIANAPLGSHTYELHIRHGRDNNYVEKLLEEIKQQGKVKIELPFGGCDLNSLSADKPIIFIARGTGFAPVKAMIEQLLATSDTRSFELFWGARLQSDLYMDDKVLQWQSHVSKFSYVSMLSKSTTETLASKVLVHHQQDIKDCQIVISGQFEMVFKTRDQLVAHGVSPENLFSDAFAFE